MADAPDPKGLTLEVEQKDDKVVVHCHGRIVADYAGNFFTRIRPLVTANAHILIDLTDVKQVDSSGLGTFVRLYVSAKSAGATLELVNLGKQIRELLGLTDLLHVLANMGQQGIIPRL